MVAGVGRPEALRGGLACLVGDRVALGVADGVGDGVGDGVAVGVAEGAGDGVALGVAEGTGGGVALGVAVGAADGEGLGAGDALAGTMRATVAAVTAGPGCPLAYAPAVLAVKVAE